MAEGSRPRQAGPWDVTKTWTGSLTLLTVTQVLSVTGSDEGDRQRVEDDCRGNSSHGLCPDSTHDARIKAGLTIGTVCLVLLVIAVGGITCYIYRHFKVDKLGHQNGNNKCRRTRKRKRDTPPRSAQTVFTVGRDDDVRHQPHYDVRRQPHYDVRRQPHYDMTDDDVRRQPHYDMTDDDVRRQPHYDMTDDDVRRQPHYDVRRQPHYDMTDDDRVHLVLATPAEVRRQVEETFNDYTKSTSMTSVT